ncbi:MAG: hypothetical protein R3A46_01315 [Thermomicrobiales bacterium]
MLHDEAKPVIDEHDQLDIWTEMMRLVSDDIVEAPILWRGSAAAVHNLLKQGGLHRCRDQQQVPFMKNFTTLLVPAGGSKPSPIRMLAVTITLGDSMVWERGIIAENLVR